MSGYTSLLSCTYMSQPRPIWRWLLAHWVRLALSLARLNAGRSIPARMAMMAMTTSSSMSAKARFGQATGCFGDSPLGGSAPLAYSKTMLLGVCIDQA